MKQYIKAAIRRLVRIYCNGLGLLPNPVLSGRISLFEQVLSTGVPNALEFDAEVFKRRINSFVESLHSGDFLYRYSPSVQTPTLYASVYACLIFHMTGRMEALDEKFKRGWADYFNAHQSSEDGLFRDLAVMNGVFENADWWGARHLILHILPAYTALGAKPKHRLKYLEPYKDRSSILDWLGRQNWKQKFDHKNDIDNKIMNILAALQYERDFLGDKRAGEAVSFMQEYFLSVINPKLSMWGTYEPSNPVELSRAIQFAYHLLTIYFYDNVSLPDYDRLFNQSVRSQNQLGGFGPQENSSACEDMDSIRIISMYQILEPERGQIDEVKFACFRAFPWLLSNQNSDGGFVFRRNEPLTYGHLLMRSNKNESGMFPTWFRLLTIALLCEILFKERNFKKLRCPGYYC